MQKQNVVGRVIGSTTYLSVSLTEQLRAIGASLGDKVNIQWDASSIVITRASEK